MRARVVVYALVAALLVLHAYVCWMSPLQGDDWDHLVWAVQHKRSGQGFLYFAKYHFTFSDLAGYFAARSVWFFMILTPLVGLAALYGLFVLATKRRPRLDDWADVAGLVLIAALVWITAPRAGVVFFHRPWATTWLYGAALAIWFFVPFRLGMRPRGKLLVLVIIAGVLAATSARPIGLLAVAVVGFAAKKSRERWMWIAFAAVTVGTVVGFIDRMFDYRGYKPAFELSLSQLNLPINEGGELISLVLGLVMTKFVVGRLWPKHAGAEAPDTSETLWWIGLWFGYVVFALLGPRYAEGTLFPASIILVIGAYPLVQWVMTSRPMKIVMLAFAIAVNGIAWTKSLSMYIPLSAQYRDRIAKLRATPKGGIASVDTYRPIRVNFFTFGEDWNEAPRRQLIAAEVFRLRDIEVAPPFRRLESNPKLDIRLEVEGVTPEQLRAAGAPEIWTTALKSARVQFDAVVEELRERVKTPFSARLVIAHDFDVLRGRPLVGATFEQGKLTTMRIVRKPPDDENRQAVVVQPRSFAAKHVEAYIIIGGSSAAAKYRGGYHVQALTTDLHAVVACDPQRCFLVDAFIPAL